MSWTASELASLVVGALALAALNERAVTPVASLTAVMVSLAF